MVEPIGKIQIGKNGITSNFISTLKTYFKKKKVVKATVLKSARGEGKEGKEKVKKYAEEILKNLGDKYTSRILGFTIALRKWRKARR